MNQLPGGLAANIRPDPTGVTVTIAGDLDMSTAPVLVDRVRTVFADDERTELTLDLTGVAFCDSAGISALVQLRQQCEQHGWRLSVVNTQPAVRRMLVDFTGLGDYLNVL